ncbi:FadR/GntR family transcriptional regulator [Nocardioides soli]|uniref:DNA-binding FadR family transcriptional regulator n=1 Tax=Nocardioides soli TaxID=1036020 RepID=A0A7W4VWQ0_9ACTN|nr:FadR/GntR family transcriptional regulator [Nocardioides soli]MBB3043105.1 DNA-binding FadR family transcriptional regulator [Nocardioides soli]
MTSATPSFGAIPPRRAASEVIAQVKDRIISGALRPGDRLPSEQELAAQLGVSRPTVRESLRALTSMNIIETRHGEGSFVSSLKVKDLIEPLNFVLHVDDDAISHLFEVRSFVEAGSARLAATHATADDLDELNQLVESYADSIDDLERCVQLDLAFHRRIADSSRNPLLGELLDSLVTLSMASRRRTGSDVHTRQSAAHDHTLILQAIAEHDPDRAEQAMLRHLEHVSQGLRSKGER